MGGPKSLTPVTAAPRWVPSTGIFAPTTGLDHRLFNEQFELRPEVAEAISTKLDICLRTDAQVAGSEWQQWVRVYIAGGSASEWAGGRPNDEAQDLDVLVGVDFAKARYETDELKPLSDDQIVTALNAAFRHCFNETAWQAPFGGTWDVTAYCNPRAWDITSIKPYAAYEIWPDMRWAVKPPHLPEHSLADFDPAVLAQARAVLSEARAILREPEPYRTQQAQALWRRIHDERSRAFSIEGEGWVDPANVIEKYLAYAPGDALGQVRELALSKTATLAGVYYHGTSREFQPGEHIEPGHDRSVDNFLPGKSEHVFYTTDPGWADDIGKLSAEHSYRTHSRVYEVRPTGPGELDTLDSRGFSFKSRDPLQVVREVRRRRVVPPGDGSVWGHYEIHEASLVCPPERIEHELKTAATERPGVFPGDPLDRMYQAEWVRTDALLPHREFIHGPAETRWADGRPQQLAPKHTPAEWDRQQRSVGEEGMREPLTLEYNPDTRRAYLGEGNSRLEWARRNGWPAVPVRGAKPFGDRDRPGQEVPGEPRLKRKEPDGYFPSTFRPSDVLPDHYMWHPEGHEPRTAVADGPFMYHGTSPAKRESIGQHGLLTSHSEDQGDWPEIYMSERPGNDPDQDVWRIDMSGYHPRIDGDSGEDRSVVGESYCVDHDIPPERLTLHSKGRGNKWIGYPPKTAAAESQLERHDYEGTTGRSDHLTASERGLIPTEALANMRGARGEMPGEHANRQGQKWDDFKDRLRNEGIQSPLFVTVDYGEEPKLSEGNHRRDYAVEEGLSHVPVEIRYFGNAQRQGTVWERHMRRRTAGLNGPLLEGIDWQHEMIGRSIHRIDAVHPDAGEIGHITWNHYDPMFREHDSGQVRHVEVYPEWQRRGIASELFRRAQQITPELHHAPQAERSDDARAWIPATAAKKDEKPTKDKDDPEIRYSDTAGTQAEHCGNCMMVRLLPPDFESGHCTLVRGLVDAEHGWCAKWYRDKGSAKEAVSLEPAADAPAIVATAAGDDDEHDYYHVSPYRLPQGTMLRPGYHLGNWDESKSTHNHVTTSLDRAEQYHHMLWDNGYPEQHIYQVIPHGPLEPDPDDSDGLMTRHPVEVAGYVFGSHDDDDGEGPSWFRHRTAVSGYTGLTDRSAMIYLDLPEGLIQGVGGGVDDHHITLVYLGNNVSDEAFAAACRRAEIAAAGHRPMDAVIGGLDSFPPSDSSDGKTPVFVPAYVPGISALRRELEDLSASEHTDYKPHVTLAYLKRGEKMPDPHPPVKVRFTHLNVKRGDDVVSFPLGTPR